MTTKIPKLFFLFAAIAISGCATSQNAKYVDPKGPNLINNVGQINIQDFALAADTMVQSLINDVINAGKLESGAVGKPALMAVSQIVNSTGTQLDLNLLTKKIRIGLLKTQQIQTTTVGNFGGAEDPLAAEEKQRREFFDKNQRPRPSDYTLSGRIIEDKTSAGRLKQSSFVFQLSLTKSGEGIAVWEDEKTITKQGTRSSVGF